MGTFSPVLPNARIGIFLVSAKDGPESNVAAQPQCGSFHKLTTRDLHDSLQRIHLRTIEDVVAGCLRLRFARLLTETAFVRGKGPDVFCGFAARPRSCPFHNATILPQLGAMIASPSLR